MTDQNSSAAEVMADNDRLIAEFLTACDDFSEALEKVMARERVAHDELMRVLRRDEE